MRTGDEVRVITAYGHLLRRPGRLAFACVAGTLLLAATAHAQLAITEMMSKSAGTLGGANVNIRADFWELTNFGSNTVDLTDYKFADNKDKKKPLIPVGAPPLFIHGGESVIFVRYYDEAFFRGWWGACLSSNVQVRTYPDPGFSGNGDLLSVYDASTHLVDRVNFDEAHAGLSFVYDPNTGAFTNRSMLGEGEACRATLSDDIASPGVTTGPIPLRIVQQPKNLVIYAQLDATFNVSAIGVPRPRDYRWYFNGTRIGNNEASLTVTNASAASEGVYSVRVANGFTTLFSTEARLTVNTNPSAPVILAPPVDATVVTGRTARFSISVAALPLASYQWFSNGMTMTGATSRTLFIPDCTLDMSGAEFCVRAKNPLGTKTHCARLYVTTRPDLRITEVQAFPVAATGTNCLGHHDWFEVTNFGSNAVDLLGYRFSDTATLLGSVAVTQPMLVEPNESVVFVKNPTVGSFIDWWGEDQLPRGLKIFPFGGLSLSPQGEAVYLWSASAEDSDEYIDSISYARNLEGVSQRFDYDLAPFGLDSVEGDFGAFRAQPCGDVGSPGYTRNPPPRFVSIAREANVTHLKWRGVAGKTYRLEYNTEAQTSNWSLLGTMQTTSSLPTWVDAPGAGNVSLNQRFYRVVELAP